jgi:hypothetical protein
MNATFRVYLPDGAILTEEQLRKNKVARETVAKLGEIEGGLTVEDPKAKEATQLGDTLEVLISAFCLDGLKHLKNKGKYHVDFFSREETVDLVVEKSKVTLSGSRITTVSYPAAAYFEAMADLGKRYLDFLKKIQ